MTGENLANIYTFSMWPRKGFKLGLKDILAVIEGEGLDWTLHWVWVTGPPPDRWAGWSIDDFERVTKTSEGVDLSWQELSAWASGLEDLQDIELKGRLRSSDDLQDGGMGRLVYFIEGFDSSQWTIRSRVVTDVSTLIAPA